MGLTPLIEQPFFEELRERAAEMIESGWSVSAMSKTLALDYPVSDFPIYEAYHRGDIIPLDTPRALARKAGNTTFEGEMCPTHMTRRRWVADNHCPKCDDERIRQSNQQKKDRSRPMPPLS